MEPAVYVFRIDGSYTPADLPMARLADYMGLLAKLLGHPEHTHFVRLEAGSARLVHQVDAVDAPKVEARLAEVAGGAGPRDAVVARDKIDDMLANDNAVGQLIRDGDGVVIPFPGRTRPKPIVYPAFRQNGSIDGQVVSIGGRDATAHAIVQDGDASYSGLSMKRELARDLAHYLYGPKVRLFGSGRWERQPQGAWCLLEFRVDRFEPLDDRPLSEVLREVRALPGNRLMEPGAYRDVTDLSSDDGVVH